MPDGESDDHYAKYCVFDHINRFRLGEETQASRQRKNCIVFMGVRAEFRGSSPVAGTKYGCVTPKRPLCRTLKICNSFFARFPNIERLGPKNPFGDGHRVSDAEKGRHPMVSTQ